jgi:predicted phosphodiesterase
MNKFTRRFFLEGCASLGALAGGRVLAAPSVTLPKPRLKFGVLSDVHVRDDKQCDSTTLKRAFAYFRDNGADAVLIAGDIADQGYVSQLKYAADAWYSVFPGDKAPDGRHVEKLFVYGNHDIDGWRWGRKKEQLEDPKVLADAIGASEEKIARTWEECFHEKFEPVWIKDVKGYKFIGCHWGHFDKVEAFVKSHAAELKGPKPFFYTQHPHPKDTCMGTWAWGHDAGQSTRALSAFPNSVAFSGHSHYTLTDERTVWQGSFTSINTSSLRYTSLDYNFRENAPGNSGGYRLWKPSGDTPRFGTGEGRQGMLVEVGDGALVIHRIEFVWGESLGDDWVVPVPAAAGGPLDFAKRAAKRKAPVFEESARAKAAVESGKDGVKFVSVSFPAAKSVDKCRVFEYEVSANILEDDVDMAVAVRRVLAPDFFLPDSKCGRSGLCRFRLSDLPQKAALRFEVRPVECFGLKGRPIFSDVFRT